MSAPRFAPLILSALCLSACAAAPGGEAVGRYAVPDPVAAAAQQAPLAALPAAAGRVVAVRTVDRSNGVSQEIVLDGPRAMAGENRITVDALTTAGDGGRGAARSQLRLGPASETEITAEMDRVLPGIVMHISPAAERDALGPFGYASGSSAGLTCVYAWQYLAPARPLSLFEGASNTGALPLSIRVRLCRDRPVAALVDALRGLTLARPGAAPVPPVAGGSASTDALSAAVGPGAAAIEPAADPAPRRASLSVASPRGARARPRPSVARRRPEPRGVAHRRAAPARDASAATPSLPLPGDVAPALPVQARLAAPPRTADRAATAGADAMPLPR